VAVQRFARLRRGFAIGRGRKDDGRRPWLNRRDPAVLKDGRVIADFEIHRRTMLPLTIQKIPRARTLSVRAAIVICVAVGITAVEKNRAVRESAESAARRGLSIEEPLAGFCGAMAPASDYRATVQLMSISGPGHH